MLLSHPGSGALSLGWEGTKQQFPQPPWCWDSASLPQPCCSPRWLPAKTTVTPKVRKEQVENAFCLCVGSKTEEKEKDLFQAFRAPFPILHPFSSDQAFSFPVYPLTKRAALLRKSACFLCLPLKALKCKLVGGGGNLLPPQVKEQPLFGCPALQPCSQTATAHRAARNK